MTVRWHHGDEDVLRVAREERRPVLLVIGARWSSATRRFREQVLTDPDVEAALGSGVLAVQADKDEHAALAARYGQGAWPSTVVLDADGEVLQAGTFIDVPVLVGMLRSAAARCRGEVPPAEDADTPDEAPRSGGPTSDVPSPDPSLPDIQAIQHSLLSGFDTRYGGFGTGQKFPHPEVLDFAILRHGDKAGPRLYEIIEKTLTRMAASPLHDAVDGGFFRYCARRDWSGPHTEKLLATNAGLLRNYLEAGQVMGRSDFLEVGERTVDAMLRDFLDAEAGLFFASLSEDDDYYAQDAAARRTRQGPRPDGRFLADANARAISALLKAGAVLRREDLTEIAVSVADRLVARLWHPSEGMYHYDDGSGPHRPGRLRDQAETARALLRVLQYTDARDFVPALADLLRRVAENHHTSRGDFADRELVRAKRPVRPTEAHFHDNAVAAEVLLRGALFFGEAGWSDLARGALAAHTDGFRRYGYSMAAFGRSVELVRHPPLHIVVVGAADDERTDALLAAASQTYLPSRVVQRLDPVEDVDVLERLALPVGEAPAAFVSTSRDDCEAADPQVLREALAAANARRLAG